MGLIFRQFLIALLGGFHLLALPVHAQTQKGFISIDCGLPETSAYSEQETGINFVSDATFIDTGETKFIQSNDLLTLNYQPYRYLRTFPQGIRNCYNINVTFGTEYLIRAGFYYGNYDAKNKLPEFQLHLGPNFWDTVNFTFSWADTTKEMIYVPVKNYIQLCLVNTSKGVPFISTIELRPLPAKSYVTQAGSFLGLFSRYNTGPVNFTADDIRYPNDIHDRIWKADYLGGWAELSTSPNLFTDSNQNSLETPPLVMSTAATPKNASEPLDFYWFSNDNSTEYYIYMHFAEVLQLQPNQSRKFNITRNGKVFYGPMAPAYLNTTTIYGRVRPTGFLGQFFSFSILKTEKSTLPPILNAYEVYSVNQLLEQETSQADFDAITNIKLAYQIKKINWQGDPCSPQVYSWDGLKCIYPTNASARIISLNLSSSGLTGEIDPSLSNLAMIQTLDLSNNKLTGPVPDFLSQLQNLTVLNLEQNQLTGPVPAGLIERWNDGLLSLSLCENPNISGNVYCKGNKKKKKKKKHGFLIPVVVSVVGVSVLLLSAIAIWWWGFRRKSKQGDNVSEAQPTIQLESTKRQLTCSEILQITNNFERVLGRGGFGTVYHGYVGDTQVAVKMLSPSSVQGFQQFHSEVNLLTRVHHRNLTSLVGYCEDETKIGLVYEYMANGNLQECLSDRNILSWEDRLRIAVDAAQGLEYLHYGCKPPIIHRDVKSTNILLNENFQAKLSDFGLSRIFPTDTGTHISTVVAGTPGYLDPDYYSSNRLNEKSDVYSFGIVLLEIITSRPVFSKTHEKIYISEWVGFMLANGDIYSILDPRLGGNFNTNSVWKAVEIAMACVCKDSIERPIMSQVVVELKECLAMELARTKQSHQTESINSIGIMPNNSIAMLHPSVR
ncbi:hypothetical protein L3X38_016177 [Prunus dulcis]|uniref:non-specific serine/threonine protein kinase n=1 Tax=Prunus dulcis TaxID=3755 RepID=A0AAD4Z9K0_PRUDU|nr:hypothetical protein L3X38_016177 [Prunus dulcis]